MVFLEFFGAFITLLGVRLTARGKTSGWLAGIGGAAIYTYICFHSKLYAESTLQAIYAGMGFYGWLAWKNTQNTSFQVKTISTLTFSLNLLIWLLLTMFTGIVLEKYADTDLPYTDAFLAAAGLVLTWQMAKRYLECWTGWMVVNLLSVIVFLFRHLYISALLYFILAILAWYGHKQWKKLFESP